MRGAALGWACAALILAQAVVPLIHAAQHGGAGAAAQHAHDAHGYGVHGSTGVEAPSGEARGVVWAGAADATEGHETARCVLCSLARTGQTGPPLDAPPRLAEPRMSGARPVPPLRLAAVFTSLADAPPRGPPFVS